MCWMYRNNKYLLCFLLRTVKKMHKYDIADCWFYSLQTHRCWRRLGSSVSNLIYNQNFRYIDIHIDYDFFPLFMTRRLFIFYVFVLVILDNLTVFFIRAIFTVLILVTSEQKEMWFYIIERAIFYLLSMWTVLPSSHMNKESLNRDSANCALDWQLSFTTFHVCTPIG